MDGSRFDALTQSFTITGSRRAALRLVAGSVVGVLTWQDREEISAHNALLKCKKLKGDKKKKCVKKAKKHNSAVPAPPPPACGTGAPCLVFLTSTTHVGGALGGLVGADAICQQKAQAASLPGTYMAWLADSTGSPVTRFVRSTGPYRRVDGVTVADNWTDLTDGSLAATLNLTETGTSVNSGPSAWTHVQADGTAEADPDHCGNWGSPSGSGDFGRAALTDTKWTDDELTNCSAAPLHLYCFQQR